MQKDSLDQVTPSEEESYSSLLRCQRQKNPDGLLGTQEAKCPVTNKGGRSERVTVESITGTSLHPTTEESGPRNLGPMSKSNGKVWSFPNKKEAFPFFPCILLKPQVYCLALA